MRMQEKSVVDHFDYVLVGGGLQNGLLALSIRHHQPQATVAIIERNEVLGGNHTWSFHDSDVPASCRAWMAELTESKWPSYEVRVGGMRRQIKLGYGTTSSERFANVVTAAISEETTFNRIYTKAIAKEVTSELVTLADGRLIYGHVVIDSRGPQQLSSEQFAGGYQKFWGFEIELEADWPCNHPIVMDDAMDQADGFRFMYTLPFEPRRVLVEDTRFSNSPQLNRDECLENVRRYLREMGSSDWTICREEHGVLPMPTSGNAPGNTLPDLCGGYRGGWFHAATGYSFPLALVFADVVGTTPAEKLAPVLRKLAAQHAGQAKFARLLNRLLFDLVKPQTRYQIFRRFYRVLSEPRIARFYGHRFGWFDAFRIVVGIPPRGLRPLNFISSLSSSRRPNSIAETSPPSLEEVSA
ncbi:lycopene beta-cyclase CrtY [Planctomycetaceae bacterium SH139]